MDKIINIRKVEEKDLDQLKALYSALLDYHKDIDPHYYARANDFDLQIGVWLRGQMQNAYTETYVAEVDGKLLGFINLMSKFWPGWYEIKETGFISYAFVLESYRGQGIGKMLFDTAENWCKQKNYPYLEVYVHSLNNIGINAWSKYGMEDKVKYLMKRL